MSYDLRLAVKVEGWGGMVEIGEPENSSPTCKSFVDWALSHGYSDDLTIERVDVNGNYEPSNCTWIPMSEQYKNKQSNCKNGPMPEPWKGDT